MQHDFHSISDNYFVVQPCFSKWLNWPLPLTLYVAGEADMFAVAHRLDYGRAWYLAFGIKVITNDLVALLQECNINK